MNLDRYIALIKAGEAVAFPTETVYGLGADAWNPDAIAKVFAIKGRPTDNPLIVHISSEDQIADFAKDIPESAQLLMQAFWPGPLTLVLQKKAAVLDAVTAGLNTVAIRLPDHPIARQFITETGPLVAPSANKSGRPSPTKAEHVRSDFGTSFPVIDGFSTNVGLESTVVDLSEKQPAILRPGAISRKQLEEVLGEEVSESFFKHSEQPRSPGQKYSHYKPDARVRWLQRGEQIDQPNFLYLLQEGQNQPNVIVYHNNLSQLASELYDRFREADLIGYTEVVLEPFSGEHSLTSALMNRISKAIGTH
jgi:L-threonylcarbamoyladenylate synthase